MESIYWVLSWLCHRRCVHCYEDRFRPYRGAEKTRAVAEAVASFPAVIRNLPERLSYRDPDGSEKPGRVILAGGEVLVEAIREPVLYPAIEQLKARYGAGLRVVVQTTGDLLTERILDQLLERGIWMISVSGLDDYHVNLEPDALKAKLTRWFERRGLGSAERPVDRRGDDPVDRPQYHFFGATPDAWIGRLWPRGRAWANDLSTATLADNFCNRWSGGLNFLKQGERGSEVAIEPDGSVYPCCMKTRLPIGNVAREPLAAILGRLRGHPVYEAISAGEPERMGERYGWSRETFLEKSHTTTPGGRAYANLCIGCDRFHEEVLCRQ